MQSFSSLKKSVADHWFLMTELVKKGIRLRYRGSYLGILWSLIEPILTTCVLVIVFGTLMRKRPPDFSHAAGWYIPIILHLPNLPASVCGATAA